LLTRRLLGEVPNYLNIKKYEVKVSKSNDNDPVNSYATVVLQVDKKDIICKGSGNGPVNAIDNAIRSNVNKIGKYSEYLKDLRLVDYKVRILNTGTNAITRVSIESTDNTGDIWFTIGVSPNIIEASFRALIDSIDYKLYKDKAPANL
jgi:2-isopropylmalate synthase